MQFLPILSVLVLMPFVARADIPMHNPDRDELIELLQEVEEIYVFPDYHVSRSGEYIVSWYSSLPDLPKTPPEQDVFYDTVHDIVQKTFLDNMRAREREFEYLFFTKPANEITTKHRLFITYSIGFQHLDQRNSNVTAAAIGFSISWIGPSCTNFYICRQTIYFGAPTPFILDSDVFTSDDGPPSSIDKSSSAYAGVFRTTERIVHFLEKARFFNRKQ